MRAPLALLSFGVACALLASCVDLAAAASLRRQRRRRHAAADPKTLMNPPPQFAIQAPEGPNIFDPDALPHWMRPTAGGGAGAIQASAEVAPAAGGAKAKQKVLSHKLPAAAKKFQAAGAGEDEAKNSDTSAGIPGSSPPGQGTGMSTAVPADGTSTSVPQGPLPPTLPGNPQIGMMMPEGTSFSGAPVSSSLSMPPTIGTPNIPTYTLPKSLLETGSHPRTGSHFHAAKAEPESAGAGAGAGAGDGAGDGGEAQPGSSGEGAAKGSEAPADQSSSPAGGDTQSADSSAATPLSGKAPANPHVGAMFPAGKPFPTSLPIGSGVPGMSQPNGMYAPGAAIDSGKGGTTPFHLTSGMSTPIAGGDGKGGTSKVVGPASPAMPAPTFKR